MSGLYLNSGEDPSFDDIDDFLRAHFAPGLLAGRDTRTVAELVVTELARMGVADD